MCEGIAEELRGIDLGDKRSAKVLEALAANPEVSINAACQGWGDTLAAYRLFDHEAVTPEAILEPHRTATQRRMVEQPVVLVAQDTTELDYTGHPPKDARCLNREVRFGLYHHVHLAVTPDRLPLGVVGTENFDRAPESLGKSNERCTLPIEEKESFRWLKGYRLACELAAQCPLTQIVSVSDREADIYDIFVDAQQQTGPRADYLIRVKEDRRTLERNPAVGLVRREETAATEDPSDPLGIHEAADRTRRLQQPRPGTRRRTTNHLDRYAPNARLPIHRGSHV